MAITEVFSLVAETCDGEVNFPLFSSYVCDEKQLSEFVAMVANWLVACPHTSFRVRLDIFAGDRWRVCYLASLIQTTGTQIDLSPIFKLPSVLMTAPAKFMEPTLTEPAQDVTRAMIRSLTRSL